MTAQPATRGSCAIPKAMALLSDLKHSKQILEACVEINRLENEADTVAQLAIGRLFAEAKDPIEVMKWKEIYDFVEGATDRCEDVANTLEALGAWDLGSFVLGQCSSVHDRSGASIVIE